MREREGDARSRAPPSALVRRMDALGLEGRRRHEAGPGERKEIGELIHRFFVSHVEGYRLPHAHCVSARG